ncbi:hypothetical protein A2U01_0081570, partial [Trifolium medium]|nr:hypothetical protein [Trifolium medium]
VLDLEQAVAKYLADAEISTQMKFDTVNSSLEEIRTMLQNLARSSVTTSQSFGNRPHEPRPPNHHPYSTRIAKIDFPRFSGKGVKEWLYQ